MSHCHDKWWLTEMGGQWWSGAALLLRKVSSLLITVTLFIFTYLLLPGDIPPASPSLLVTPPSSFLRPPDPGFLLLYLLWHTDLLTLTCALQHTITKLHCMCTVKTPSWTLQVQDEGLHIEIKYKENIKFKIQNPCPHLSYELACWWMEISILGKARY